MSLIRRIYPTRFGQMHVRSRDGRGGPLGLFHLAPRGGAMGLGLKHRRPRPTYAPDRLGYGYSDAPPWALSLEQYAQSTVDALDAAAVGGPFDVLATHVGSVEAVEIAQQIPGRVRRMALVGMPVFTADEQQRQMEKYSEQPLRPVSEGGHVLGAWRGCFAFRQPPYDLIDVHRRFVEHVVAANPGAALRAVCGYPLEKKLKTVKVPLTVLAPHDELIEQTRRVVALLRPEVTYIELPEVGLDPFHADLDRMIDIVNRHLPP